MYSYVLCIVPVEEELEYRAFLKSSVITVNYLFHLIYLQISMGRYASGTLLILNTFLKRNTNPWEGPFGMYVGLLTHNGYVLLEKGEESK